MARHRGHGRGHAALNFFVSDNGLGDGRNVGEKATLATQRVLLGLRAAGRSPSRLIGASLREGRQVATLAGLEALLNVSGLCSFATDQKAFDDRVRSLL